jgi:hypothetical protein
MDDCLPIHITYNPEAQSSTDILETEAEGSTFEK